MAPAEPKERTIGFLLEKQGRLRTAVVAAHFEISGIPETGKFLQGGAGGMASFKSLAVGFSSEKRPLRKTMLRANRHFLPSYIWHLTHRVKKFVQNVPIVQPLRGAWPERRRRVQAVNRRNFHFFRTA
jgi:hypothetical protein